MIADGSGKHCESGKDVCQMFWVRKVCVMDMKTFGREKSLVEPIGCLLENFKWQSRFRPTSSLRSISLQHPLDQAAFSIKLAIISDTEASHSELIVIRQSL